MFNYLLADVRPVAAVGGFLPHPPLSPGEDSIINQFTSCERDPAEGGNEQWQTKDIGKHFPASADGASSWRSAAEAAPTRPGPVRPGPARPGLAPPGQPHVDEKWEEAKLPHLSFRRNPEYQMEERLSRPCHESSGICTGSVHEGARVLVIASGIHSVDHIP